MVGEEIVLEKGGRQEVSTGKTTSDCCRLGLFPPQWWRVLLPPFRVGLCKPWMLEKSQRGKEQNDNLEETITKPPNEFHIFSLWEIKSY